MSDLINDLFGKKGQWVDTRKLPVRVVWQFFGSGFILWAADRGRRTSGASAGRIAARNLDEFSDR